MGINPLQLPPIINVPRVDFSSLAQLGKDYRAGQKRMTLADLGSGLADGTLDYRKAAGMAAKTGDLQTTLALLKMGEEAEASKQFTARYGGGGATPATSPPSRVPSTDGSFQPRGLRNNNPLNIEAGPFTHGQPGYQGSDGRFARFGSPEEGLSAASNLLDVYGRKHGINTISGVIARWAPASDGNPVPAYANFVARKVGIAPDAPIDLSDPTVRQKLSSAMAEFENGRPLALSPTAQSSTPAVAAPATVAGGSSAAINDAGGAAGTDSVAPPVRAVNPAQDISGLIAAAGNPRLPAPQREIAKALLSKALDDSKLTNEEKQYIRFRVEGGADDFTTWDRKNRQASATAITNDMRGESAEAAGLGKGAAERANATMEAARGASKTLANLSRVDALLGNLRQGKVEPARMTISAWAKSLGLDDATAERIGLDPKRVGDAQALQALANETVVGKIGAGGFPANNFSDADRHFIVTTVQQLGNDPRANKIITETARRVARLDIEKGHAWMSFRRNQANKGKSYDDFEIAWADRVAERDLFGDLRKEAEAMIGVQPPGERGTAPSPMEGARQGRDGNWYVPDPSRSGKFLMVQ